MTATAKTATAAKPAGMIPSFVRRAASSLFPGPVCSDAVATMRPPAVPTASPARGLWDPALADAFFLPRSNKGLGLVLSPAVALRSQSDVCGLGLEVSLTDRVANRRAGLAPDAAMVPAGMPLMAVPLSSVRRCHGRDESEAMLEVMSWLRKCSARAAYDGSAAGGWDAVARSYRARFEGQHDILASNAATDWAAYVALSRCHHFTSQAAVEAATTREAAAGGEMEHIATPRLPHNDDAAGIAFTVPVVDGKADRSGASEAPSSDEAVATVTFVPGVDFVNHSGEPTAQMYRLGEAEKHLSLWANWVAGVHTEHLEEDHLFLVALRDIHDGEEVTITYADFDPATDVGAWRDHVGFVPDRAPSVLQQDAEAIAAAHLERFLLAKAPNVAAEAL
jgi:hypothetical protein